MGLAHSPHIVRDGLAFYLDAANTKSYPGSGTTWTDISGKDNDGTKSWAGISGRRFKRVKKDLADFQYDELINNHLYRTGKGQQIWLKLGYPYVLDQSPGKNS